MEFVYYPKGVCSTKYIFDIENNIIKNVSIENGCNGNLQGISRLIKGKDIDEIINTLQGINCNGKGTSCPDQISKALKEFKEKQ